MVMGRNRVPLDGESAATPVAQALARRELTMAELISATACDPDDIAAVVDRLDHLGLVRHTVVVDGKRLLDLEPMTARPSWWSNSPAGATSAVTLSRFAFARGTGGHLVVESPLSNYQARVRAPETAALIMLLAQGVAGVGDLSPCAEAAEAEAMSVCVELLVHTGLAVSCRVTDDGKSGEWCADGREFAGWSFHDLLFHSRSRQGVHNYPIGRLYPLRGKLPPLPATPSARGTRLQLERVDIERIERADPTFTAVLEGRHSVRRHCAPSISLRTLGEFLFRCARIRSVIPPDPDSGIHYQSSDRPYPSGGGAYELEIYPVVGDCEGLVPGIYHYAADAHALDQVAAPSRRTQALLTDAAAATALTGSPQVLPAITARFARVSWKYSGMAYATILKNVGVLYQTMYLVATAMGLAPCAIGTGSSARLSGILDLPYGEESMVGEFLIGAPGQAESEAV